MIGVLSVLALSLGLVAPSAPAGAGSSQVEAASSRVTGKVRVKLSGQHLGGRATVTVTGVRGKAKGLKRSLRLKRVKTIKGLRPGVYRLRAKRIVRDGAIARASRIKPRKVRVVAGQRTDVTVRYRKKESTKESTPTVTVAGVVLDPDGQPIADFPVCVIWYHKTGTFVRCLARTSADGSFSVHYVPESDPTQGWDELRVGDPVSDSPWASQEAVDGVNTVQPRKYVSGTVTDEAHHPVVDKEVCYTPDLGISQPLGDPLCDRTDREGRYRIRSDWYGPIEVMDSRLFSTKSVDEVEGFLATTDFWWDVYDEPRDDLRRYLFPSLESGRANGGPGEVVDLSVTEVTPTSGITLRGASAAANLPVCAATLADLTCTTTGDDGSFTLELPTARRAHDPAGPVTVKVMTKQTDEWMAEGWLVQAEPGGTIDQRFDPSGFAKIIVNMPPNSVGACVTDRTVPPDINDENWLSWGQYCVDSFPAPFDGGQHTASVQPGDYRVAIDDPATPGIQAEWVGGDGSWDQATVFTVGAGQTITVP